MNKQEALNKIKELQKYIEGLDKKQEYRPRVEKGSPYFRVYKGSCGVETEQGDEYDNWGHLTGNYFICPEEAQEYRNYLKALGEIRNYIKDNDLWFKPDWKDESQDKYVLYYNYQIQKWEIHAWTWSQTFHRLPYLQSAKHAQQVIDNCQPQLEMVRKWHEKNL